MTDKAYIVANKEQELDVLNKFELKELVWLNGKMPTNWVPSKDSSSILFEQFPYALVEIESENKKIAWLAMGQLTDEEIVYDGRKEEKMYKVTHEFMKWLIKWRDDEDIDATSGESFNYINDNDLDELPADVVAWWVDDKDPIERNNRLIAIIQWLNGEDVFEVEAPHKFVVRSNDIDEDGDYWYVKLYKGLSHSAYNFGSATKFDTQEEAQEWANSHQVVVEIDAEGNEVE